MSKGKTGRPAGPTIMPTDNDWRVLRAIIQQILRSARLSGRSLAGTPYDEECSCTMGFVDIGNAIGMHSLMVRDHVRRLEERGLLRRERALGRNPTTYFVTWRVVCAACAVLDGVVGLWAPWPDRTVFDH